MFAVPMVMVLYLAPQFVKCQEFCLKWFETHCRNAEKSWSLICVKYFQNWQIQCTVLSSNSLYDYVSDFIEIIFMSIMYMIHSIWKHWFTICLGIWKIKWSIIIHEWLVLWYECGLDFWHLCVFVYFMLTPALISCSLAKSIVKLS